MRVKDHVDHKRGVGYFPLPYLTGPRKSYIIPNNSFWQLTRTEPGGEGWESICGTTPPPPILELRCSAKLFSHLESSNGPPLRKGGRGHPSSHHSRGASEYFQRYHCLVPVLTVRRRERDDTISMRFQPPKPGRQAVCAAWCRGTLNLSAVDAY
jgi:hypothetical protein